MGEQGETRGGQVQKTVFSSKKHMVSTPSGTGCCCSDFLAKCTFKGQNQRQGLRTSLGGADRARGRSHSALADQTGCGNQTQVRVRWREGSHAAEGGEERGTPPLKSGSQEVATWWISIPSTIIRTH